MSFFGGIGNAIKSGANTAVGIAPYASRLLAQRQAQDEADQQRKLLQMYQANADKRAEAMLKISQQNADTKGEGQWTKPFASEDENGPGMFQQHNITGQVRRVQVSDGAPKSAPPGVPINAAPSFKSAIPDSALGRSPSAAAPAAPMPGDSQDMGDASSAPQAAFVEQAQQPRQAPATAAAPKPGTLRPYVKPTAVKPTRDPVADHQANRLFDIAHPVPVQGDRTLVQINGPDGNPIWVPREQAIGKEAKTTTRVESATNTAAQARLTAAVSEMNNAHANMTDYENRLASGQAHISAGAQVLQRVANAFTHDDPLSQLSQSGALAALNKTDPDLARYIRRGLSFAEGESMISQRPSDFRTRMSAFLSTAASGASPDMIHDIQGRRTAILNPLNNTVGTPKPSGRGGGRGSGPPANVPHPPNQHDTPGDVNLSGKSKVHPVVSKYGITPPSGDEE